MLLPQEKLYADLNEASQDPRVGELQADSESISLNSLLHETNISPRYERLGQETINGRGTVRYRVTADSSTNSPTVIERFIWVDEILGMPVKSEVAHTEGDRSSKVLMQLTDIRTDVDLGQFEIPGDYRKVNASLVFDLIARTARTIPAEKPQK